jgi:hypothetical protein
MKKVLVWIYEDILKFHLRAWRLFSESGMLHLCGSRNLALSGRSVETDLHGLMEKFPRKLQASPE